MKKYHVIRAFIDKTNNEGYNIGDTFASDDVERVSFLTKKGYLLVSKQLLQGNAKVDEALIAEAKVLKIKGYTKMEEETLRKAIDVVKTKKASESDGE
ncbi:hypothetical protein JTI58_01660 [Lysinibacillus fusiformis]|uniref:hypothetical protein n=1 Tax=Lysinibacillus fusiformis TaxID=28031 RepID=UPI0019681DA2|nr:hypothetical protein [Lysinibacillus fusiformis]QSB10449.1 hypothetical protein JTI58_01660 [Lysinibacillus fusiformis]